MINENYVPFDFYFGVFLVKICNAYKIMIYLKDIINLSRKPSYTGKVFI